MTAEEQKVLHDWLLEHPKGFTYCCRLFTPCCREYNDFRFDRLVHQLARGYQHFKRTIFPRVIADTLQDHNNPYIQFDEGAPI